MYVVVHNVYYRCKQTWFCFFLMKDITAQQSNLCTTVTLGEWQGDCYMQGDRYIRVNFAEKLRQLKNFGKLSGNCNIQGDHYIQV